jgi:threonyl-tRNA synthetase
MEKIPYLLIVGEQEAQANKVSVRTPRNAEKPDQGQMVLEEFINRAEQEIETRGAAHAT